MKNDDKNNPPPVKTGEYGNILKNTIIKKINQVINQPWEMNCRQNGKKVNLPFHWKQPVRDLDICEEYRKKGWYVFHVMDGDTEEYIIIRHPKYFSYRG